MAARRRDDPEFAALQNARARLFYRTHRTEICERERIRTKETPGRTSLYAAAYRARRAGAESFNFTERDWWRLMARYRFCCAYYGINPGRNDKGKPILHKEHVVPLSRGGRHSIGNILPACPQCNQGKLGRTIMEWREATRRYEAMLTKLRSSSRFLSE